MALRISRFPGHSLRLLEAARLVLLPYYALSYTRFTEPQQRLSHQVLTDL